jgi:hypothetical protein
VAKRTKTPSFVVEVPLRVRGARETRLIARFRAGQNLYNACLGESLRRIGLMRESRDWRRARAMPKHCVGEDGKGVLDEKGRPKANPERRVRFRDLRQRFGFSTSELQAWMQQCRDACWIGDHLGSHDAQRISERAFEAVSDYAYGKKGKPRFQRLDEFTSIEGKDNRGVITWRMAADGSSAHVSYLGLKLDAVLPKPGKDPWLETALRRRTKYVRIVRRAMGAEGRAAYAVQLIQEGLSPLKAWHRKALAVRPDTPVGADQGPSNVAVVAERGAELMQLAPKVVQPWQGMRRIARAMDRSRRATNPENYAEDGTIRRGKKRWVKSSRYRALQSRRANKERKLAAERKRSHGEQTSRVLLSGTSLTLEKVSYRAFQKSFGRSTKVRGVGAWVSMARRKATRFASKVVEVPCSLRLSQYDHTTKDYQKKKLSERQHCFRDGKTAPVQRDLYSAFLARHVRADDGGKYSLDAPETEKSWQAAEPSLRAASSGTQPAKGTGLAGPHVVALARRRRSRLSAEGGLEVCETVHGVAAGKAGSILARSVREGREKRTGGRANTPPAIAARTLVLQDEEGSG